VITDELLHFHLQSDEVIKCLEIRFLDHHSNHHTTKKPSLENRELHKQPKIGHVIKMHP